MTPVYELLGDIIVRPELTPLEQCREDSRQLLSDLFSQTHHGMQFGDKDVRAQIATAMPIISTARHDYTEAERAEELKVLYQRACKIFNRPFVIAGTSERIAKLQNEETELMLILGVYASSDAELDKLLSA